MKRAKLLVLNTFFLTAASLVIRSLGLGFQVYLSNQIGAAGIGLLQLITSVTIFAMTLSSAGMRLAATRLVAEELGTGHNAGAKKAVRLCLTHSILLSTTVAVLLFCNARWIGTRWMGDARTVLSLRCLAIDLPFISMASVLGGYFTAVRKAFSAAAVQIADEIIKILLTVFLLPLLPKGLEYACAAVVFSSSLGDICAFLVLALLFATDIRHFPSNEKTVSEHLLKRLLTITIPVSFNACVTSCLRTIQHLLVPSGLKKSGASAESALASLGIIQGMVMPILTFPAVLLYAVAELIVPELAECRARGNDRRLNYIINRMLRLVMLFAFGVTSIVFTFSGELSYAIFKSDSVTTALRFLAPIIPILYLDSLVDNMLKGLGEQISTMRYNIMEALLSIALICALLPRYAIAGYFFTIYFARIFNFSLSLNRLIRVVEVRISLPRICKAAYCAVMAPLTLKGFSLLTRWQPQAGIAPLTAQIFLVTLIYLLLLRLFHCITGEDAAWLASVLKPERSSFRRYARWRRRNAEC